jgi:hypothetical protein
MTAWSLSIRSVGSRPMSRPAFAGNRSRAGSLRCWQRLLKNASHAKAGCSSRNGTASVALPFAVAAICDYSPGIEYCSALGQQVAASFVVDGEIVTFKNGLIGFAKLQQRMRVTRPSANLLREVPVWFYLFDLLYLDRHDTRQVALRYRKELLRDAFAFFDARRSSRARAAFGSRWTVPGAMAWQAIEPVDRRKVAAGAVHPRNSGRAIGGPPRLRLVSSAPTIRPACQTTCCRSPFSGW